MRPSSSTANQRQPQPPQRPAGVGVDRSDRSVVQVGGQAQPPEVPAAARIVAVDEVVLAGPHRLQRAPCRRRPRSSSTPRRGRLRGDRRAARSCPTACAGGPMRSTRGVIRRRTAPAGRGSRCLRSATRMAAAFHAAVRSTGTLDDVAMRRCVAPVRLADGEQPAALPGETAEAHAAVGRRERPGAVVARAPRCADRPSRRTRASPSSVAVHAPPPYSCTRERAFHGAGEQVFDRRRMLSAGARWCGRPPRAPTRPTRSRLRRSGRPRCAVMPPRPPRQ